MTWYRSVLVCLWGATTALATGVSWVGVSFVTRTITDSHPVALTPPVVAGLVQDGEAGGALTVPPRSEVVPGMTTTTVAPSVSSLPAANAGSSGPRATTVGPPVSPASTSRPPPTAAPPTTGNRSPSPTAPQAQAASASFSTRGGVVIVSCSGMAIRLDSARPEDGYRFTARNTGPDRVEVTFSSTTRTSDIRASCRDGRPVREDGAPPGGGGGPGPGPAIRSGPGR